MLDRDSVLELLHEHVKSDSLRKHCLGRLLDNVPTRKVRRSHRIIRILDSTTRLRRLSGHVEKIVSRELQTTDDSAHFRTLKIDLIKGGANDPKSGISLNRVRYCSRPNCSKQGSGRRLHIGKGDLDGLGGVRADLK